MPDYPLPNLTPMPSANELIKHWLKEPPAEAPRMDRIARYFIALRYPEAVCLDGQEYRKARKLSQRKLANELSGSGFEISRSAIAAAESYADPQSHKSRKTLGPDIIRAIAYYSCPDGHDPDEWLRKTEYCTGHIVEDRLGNSPLAEEVAELALRVESMEIELQKVRSQVFPDAIAAHLRAELKNHGIDAHTKAGRKRIANAVPGLAGQKAAAIMIAGGLSLSFESWPVIVKMMTKLTKRTWSVEDIENICLEALDKRSKKQSYAE